MELLNGLGIPELTKPELTGDWEFQLRQVQRRQKSRAEFMAGIAEMTRHIVDRAKKFEHDTIPGDFGVLNVPCPKCGGEVHESYKAFQCVERAISRSGRSSPAGMFEDRGSRAAHPRKAGRPAAGVPQQAGQAVRRGAQAQRREQDRVRFRQRPANGGTARPAEVDFTGKEPLGKCPKCERARVRNGDELRLRESGRRRAHLRLPRRQSHPPAAHRARRRCRSCWRPARPICWTSSSQKRTGPSRPSWCSKDGEVGVRVRAARKRQGTPAREPSRRNRAERSISPGRSRSANARSAAGGSSRCEEAYVCEKSQADRRALQVQDRQVILQQPVDRAQVRQAAGQEPNRSAEPVHLGKAGRPSRPSWSWTTGQGRLSSSRRAKEPTKCLSAAASRRRRQRVNPPGRRIPGGRQFLQHLATDRGASVYTLRNYRHALREFAAGTSRSEEPTPLGTAGAGRLPGLSAFPGATNLGRAAIHLRFSRAAHLLQVSDPPRALEASPIRNISLPKLANGCPSS